MSFRQYTLISTVCSISLTVNVTAQQTYNLEETRHDLALYSTPRQSDVTADAQCIFCHLPGRSSTRLGLWNESRAVNILDYPYDRPSDNIPAGKPNGATLLCLACHDGTVAPGDVLNRVDSRSTDNGISRTDLADGHPVSLLYDDSLLVLNAELEHPDRLPEQVKLDSTGRIQCTTCHDPHEDRYGNFLVVDNTGTALCQTCHVITEWNSSTHSSSYARWNFTGPDPWPYSDLRGSVADHGCFNCHTPHTAGNGKYLLNYNIEEDNCLSCHNGNVAGTNIGNEFVKLSRHTVDASAGKHDADEDILIKPANRHIECTDCHDPHKSGGNGEDGISPALNGVRGIDISGGMVATVTLEYELCLRCHGDSPGKQAMPVPRVHDQNNVRLQFDNGNPSFHPVAGPGNNTNVPSLIAPLNESSTIRCTDCHTSDDDTRAGGKGPNGPHGSIYPHMLVRSYLTRDRTPESPTAYALCYLCHDRDSILSDESFPLHRLHITNENTPCSVCHDAHGISTLQGNGTNNTHLINFDTSVVFSTRGNEIYFEDRGSFRGACYLNCHNSEHDNFSY